MSIHLDENPSLFRTPRTRGFFFLHEAKVVVEVEERAKRASEKSEKNATETRPSRQRRREKKNLSFLFCRLNLAKIKLSSHDTTPNPLPTLPDARKEETEAAEAAKTQGAKSCSRHSTFDVQGQKRKKKRSGTSRKEKRTCRHQVGRSSGSACVFEVRTH
jgi:hypothetical protein